MASSVVVIKSPEVAHQEICAKHGTFEVEKGVMSRLWGGEGNYTIDTVGERNFESHRDEVDRLGKANGCHTCGRFKGRVTPPNARTGNPMGHWVCDHQPPLGIVPDATRWQLYPQCHECSNEQWGKSKIYINAFKKRTGMLPSKYHQHLFWGSGRAHRSTTKYDVDYSGGGEKLKDSKYGDMDVDT